MDDYNKYKYKDKWERRSSIRTRPRKSIDFNESGFFFPVSKQAFLMLPELLELDYMQKTEISIHLFRKYLHDVSNEELKIVNIACNHLIANDLIIKFPEYMKLDAFTIILDEYYHVYIGEDLLDQLDNQFPNLQTLIMPLPDTYNAMIQTKQRIDSKYEGVMNIVAACIFETSIVSELLTFFDNEEIHPSIKHYINTHLNDEARHHVFFTELLSYTWKSLPEEYKEVIGLNLADFVMLYLDVESEKSYNTELLSMLLNDKDKALRLIEDIYGGFTINKELPLVKNVLTLFEKTGLLNCKFVNEGLKKSNLLC
ncbi:MAG: diiron oxygenase [Neisseriaceae bacterium]|jgi:hypothetical protein